MNAPPDPDAIDCRTRLIRAAAEVFVEEGYQASVERLAVRAGVARQTLYNHFPCKADLFGEVVRQATRELLISLDGEDISLRERLLRFGALYREKVFSSEGLGFYRTIVAETVRFPGTGGQLLPQRPQQTGQRLAAILGAAMEQGELRADEPAFAANVLLSMLAGAERTRYLFSAEPPPPPDPACVNRLVDCFLRAFAPEASAKSTSITVAERSTS